MVREQIDFDHVVQRCGTESFKWDYTEAMLGVKDVLPLWVADMDFQSPPAIIQALHDRVDHGVFGYTGHGDRLRAAVVDWLYARHRWQVASEWISFMPGVVAALRLAIDVFTEPGDKIIVQPPVYYPFFKVITDNHRQIVENPLMEVQGSYQIDFDSLEKCLEDGAAMLVLCSPHNPVGRVWTKSELGQLMKLCLRYGTLVVSDEIWSDLLLGDAAHSPIASLGEQAAANSITCIAPSKTFNLAGLTTSSVIIPDPAKKRLYDQAINRQDLGLGNVLGMVAMQTAYEECEPWLTALDAYLSDTIAYVKSYLQTHHPEVRWIEPEATYLLWLDLRALTGDDVEIRKAFYEHAKLGVHLGSKFGTGGSGFIRLNIASPRTIIEDAMGRFSEAIRYLKEPTE